MNLVNATVAYAVEDIVIGDLIYNQSVDFMWIDWQQGNFTEELLEVNKTPRSGSITFDALTDTALVTRTEA
jgi:hypothetical protein